MESRFIGVTVRVPHRVAPGKAGILRQEPREHHCLGSTGSGGCVQRRDRVEGGRQGDQGRRHGRSRTR